MSDKELSNFALRDNELSAFAVKNMPESGNCLFNCVALLVKGNAFDDQVLRVEAVNYITEKWGRFRDYIGGHTSEEYASHMACSGVRAGYAEMIALSEIYNMQICVYRQNGALIDVPIEIGPVNAERKINLLHSGPADAGHYDVLLPSVRSESPDTVYKTVIQELEDAQARSLRKKSEAKRRRYSQMTRDEKTRLIRKKSEEKRTRIAQMTDEERARMLKEKADAERRRVSQMTEEERADMLKERAEAERRRVSQMTQEERARMLKGKADSQRRRVLHMSEEERAQMRKRKAEAERRRLSQLTEEERARMLQRKAEAERRRLSQMTEEQRARLCLRKAEAERRRVAQMTEVERAKHLRESESA